MILWASLILSSTSLVLTAWLIWSVRQKSAMMIGDLRALSIHASQHDNWAMAAREQDVDILPRMVRSLLAEELDAREAARKAAEQAAREEFPTGSFLPQVNEAQREADLRRTSRRLTLTPTPSAAPSSSSGRPSSRGSSPSAAKPSGGTP